MNDYLIISAIIQAVATAVIAGFTIVSWYTMKKIKEENKKLTKHNFEENKKITQHNFKENKKLIKAIVASNITAIELKETHTLDADGVFKVFHNNYSKVDKITTV